MTGCLPFGTEWLQGKSSSFVFGGRVVIKNSEPSQQIRRELIAVFIVMRKGKKIKFKIERPLKDSRAKTQISGLIEWVQGLFVGSAYTTKACPYSKGQTTINVAPYESGGSNTRCLEGKIDF